MKLILALALALCLARTAAADPHQHHAPPPQSVAEPALRTSAEYRVPALRLVRADGKQVALADELDQAGPVVLNFVFTTCTAICPILSQQFAQLQARADPALRLRLMSISIDPLNDTPAVLHDYAKQFKAGSNWHFYTGTAAASIAAQRAFDVYRGNKMNHVPLTLVRRARDQPWVRLEGYASVDAVLRELAP